MEKQMIIDGYKSLEGWSKWLVTIETALCAGLWPKLTGTPRPPASLYLGWFMFVGSIITTAIMLVAVAFYIQRAHATPEQDVNRVKIFVAVQYGFFLGGVVCFCWRILEILIGGG